MSDLVVTSDLLTAKEDMIFHADSLTLLGGKQNSYGLVVYFSIWIYIYILLGLLFCYGQVWIPFQYKVFLVIMIPVIKIKRSWSSLTFIMEILVLVDDYFILRRLPTFCRRHIQIHFLVVFRLKFHWSLFRRVQYPIRQHCLGKWLGAQQATIPNFNQCHPLTNAYMHHSSSMC